MVISFYFESLYHLNACSDWLNALKLFERISSSCQPLCPLKITGRYFLTMEENLPSNFYNSIVEGSIEEEEVDIKVKVRLAHQPH